MRNALCALCAGALKGCRKRGPWALHLWTAGLRDYRGFVWKVKTRNSNSYVSYPMTYTSWHPGEPNAKWEACVAVTETGGYRNWNNAKCWSGYCFVCEMEITLP